MWNVSTLTTTINFMENKTFNDYSTQNYDNLLIGWASRPVKPNLTISFEQLDAQAHQQMQLQY
jgi:hypothetical protein